jgi:hypothetical protein
MSEREEHGKPPAGTERMNRAELEAVRFNIAQREFLRVCAAFERDAGLFPHRAVSAVAACEIPSMDRLLTTVGMAQCAGNAIRLLPHRFKFDATLDDDTARFEMCGQHGLGFGLGHEQDEWKAGVLAADVPQVDGRRLTAIDVQQQARRRPTAAGELFTQSQRLENLEAPRLNRQRARLTGTVVSLFDNPEPNAKPCELGRERQPRRPGAHHEHVKLRGWRRCGIHAHASHNIKPGDSFIAEEIAERMPIRYREHLQRQL